MRNEGIHGSKEIEEFYKLSRDLEDLGAEIRDDLSNDTDVVVECSKSNEDECVKLVQQVYDKFKYNVAVRCCNKGKVVSIKEKKKVTVW